MQSEYYGTFENLSKSFLSSSGRISEWDYLKAFWKKNNGNPMTFWEWKYLPEQITKCFIGPKQCDMVQETINGIKEILLTKTWAYIPYKMWQRKHHKSMGNK